MGYPPTFVVIGSISTVLLMMIFRHLIINRLFKFKIKDFVKNVYLPVFYVVIPLLLFFTLPRNTEDSFIKVFLIVVTAFILSISSIWFFGLNKIERLSFINLMSYKFFKINKVS